jgi:hypothetical protein
VRVGADGVPVGRLNDPPSCRPDFRLVRQKKSSRVRSMRSGALTVVMSASAAARACRVGMSTPYHRAARSTYSYSDRVPRKPAMYRSHTVGA